MHVFSCCTSARFCVHVRQIRILLLDLVRVTCWTHLGLNLLVMFDTDGSQGPVLRVCITQWTVQFIWHVRASCGIFPSCSLLSNFFALLCAVLVPKVSRIPWLLCVLRFQRLEEKNIPSFASFVCLIIRLWSHNLHLISCKIELFWYTWNS